MAVDIEDTKSDGFSSVAQSIRTQLHAIMGFSEMLKLGIADETERKNALDSILASSRSLQRLVDELQNRNKAEGEMVAEAKTPAVSEAKHRRRLSSTQVIKLTVTDFSAKVKRVLVVDDSPVNLAVLKAMITRFGIKDVVSAANGKMALEKLTAPGAQPFDLVLTDMWMPEMDGDALVAEIRKNPLWAHLPVYAVTADVEVQKKFAQKGFSGILLKPLTLQKLKPLLG